MLINSDLLKRCLIIMIQTVFAWQMPFLFVKEISMKELLQRREEIDRQIQKLLQEKMKLNESLAVAEEPSDDLRQMLQNAIEHIGKSFPERATVACQGVEGAYSEAAAKKLFKEPGILYFKNFNNIFDAIENGLCEFGILPIEKWKNTADQVQKRPADDML